MADMTRRIGSALVAATLIAGCWNSYSPHYEPGAPHFMPDVAGVVASVESQPGKDWIYTFDDGRTLTVDWPDGVALPAGNLLLAVSSPQPRLFGLRPSTSVGAPAGCFMFETSELYEVDGRANADFPLGPGDMTAPRNPAYLSLPIADGFTAESVAPGNTPQTLAVLSPCFSWMSA